MSDSSEDLKGERQGEGNYDGTCRDFIRGICSRKYCKYKHEVDIHHLNFCHDFQNSSCPRPNCKFIHCSPDEEDMYKTTGEMSNQILAEASRKSQLPGFQPVCCQFQKGLCRRQMCKYRHITKEDSEKEIRELLQHNPNNKNKFEMSKCILNNMDGSHSNLLITGVPRWNNIHVNEDFGVPAAKRRFITSDEIEYAVENECNLRQPLFKGYFASNPPLLSGVDARTMMLEEENNMLHNEISQLKKRVSDLTATNEFLLDQNANLRITGQRNGTVTVPAVTITNTIPQNNTTTQVIRTVTANVATVPGVPVSIATVSAGNQVSASHVSIAGCPAVSIAPTQILAPSQQILVTANPPSQLTIANSSQGQLAISAQPTQQLTLSSTSQANQQLVLTTTTAPQAQQTQQLALVDTSQAQQLGLTSNTQQLTVSTVPQQLLAASNQLEMHRTNQLTAISTSQAIALSNATQPMVSYPIMTQTMTHALTH